VEQTVDDAWQIVGVAGHTRPVCNILVTADLTSELPGNSLHVRIMKDITNSGFGPYLALPC